MKKFLQHRKGVLALLLALFLGMGTAYAADFSATCSTGQTLYYNITDATNHYVEITCPGTSNEDGWQGFTKPTGNITLPSTVTYNSVTYTVTKIGDYAFYGCSGLTGPLNISATVTTIGHFAFANCYGFTGSLTIPNSVTLIGHYAFMDCQGFTGSLTIPNSVTLIDYGAFRECYGFTGSLIIGSSVTTISNYAFANCRFTSMMVLPETPPSLGIEVFQNVPTSITVYVPCGQMSAYQNASGWSSFNNMQCLDILTYSINDDGVSVTVTGNLYGTAATGPLVIPETKTIDGVTYTVTTIGYNAFCGCSGFTGSLTIPNSVTTIGFQAFAECSGFTGSLSIPNSVTTIDFGAFGWCPNFTGTLTLSNSLTVIGDFAFYLDSGFTGMLTIPNSVTSIGESAFSSCHFTGLTLGNSLTTIGKHAFHACHTFTGPLTIPNSVTTIGSHAFYACDNFTSLTLGNSVTTIGSWAFNSCDGLQGSLTIPNSVTTIGDSAFGWCQGFNGTLTIGTGVTSMGASVFDSDDGFTEVIYNAINCANVEYTAKPFEGCGGSLTIGNAVQRIPSSMFLECTGFTSLTIGNSVTSIGWRAFDGCSGFMGNLVIPNSVTEISDYAFRNCSGFNGSLTLGSSLTSIGDLAFAYCGFTGTLSIPNSVTTIGQAAFYECTGLTGELIIPGSVIQIQNSAFYYCSGFTGPLTIPNSVTLIGNYAFCGCSGFTGMLTIGASVSSIGNDAFNGCTGLTSMMVYPETPPTLGSNAFYSMPTTAPVKVPCGKLNTYQSASGWNAFSNMLEYCDPLTYSINADGVSVTVTGHVDGTSATGELFIPETKIINGVTYTVTKIGNNAFRNCSGLTGSLTIPNSVTSIGSYAFYNCSGFTGSLTLGNSLTTIDRYAFRKCSGFTGPLILGNSLTTLSTGVFQECSGFTSLTLDNSLTTIGTDAFTACYGLSGDLTIPNSVTTLNNYAFWYCTGFTGTLTIGSGVTSIGKNAFGHCTGLTQVNYNAINCADVDEDTKPFIECTNATTLTIGSNVTRIPAYMFFQCSNFTGSLSIPNSVTSIGNYAFCECSGFNSSLSLGNSLTTIGNFALFAINCTGPLYIPESVTTIGNFAFAWCQGFTSLTINNSVTTIGNNSFYYCNNLAYLTVRPEIPPTLGNSTFEGVPSDIPVHVPCGSISDYQAASGWSDFTNYQCIETLTVYEGTNTSSFVPAYIYYFDDFTRSQFVIPADDLADMIGTPITSMTFYTSTTNNNVPYTTVSSADVYLKEVDYTNISEYELEANATTVYSGYFDIVRTGNVGEMTIHFSTPYIYQGGNLMVGVENTEDNGWKSIYFYGQTVTGASIAGYDASSTENIPATQRNFIPKTTFAFTPSECSRPIDLTATDITSNSAMLQWTGFQDSYNLRYRVAIPFFEDFEDEETFAADWTFISNNHANDIGVNNNSAGLHTTASHSGTYGFRFSSYHSISTGEDYNQYLVSPKLTVTGELKFYFKKYNNSTESLYVGYSTTGNDIDDFTWTEDLVPTTSWQEYTQTLPSNVKYIAFHYYGNYTFHVYLDDITIGGNGIPIGEWINVNNVASTTTEITGLDPHTNYLWQVRGIDASCNDNGLTTWSKKATFTTKCETILVDANNPFLEDFDGGTFVPDCWETFSTGSYQWTGNTYSGYAHSGSTSAYSYYYGDNYLVLPNIELPANAPAVQLTFWSLNRYPTYFVAGNNTVVLLNGNSETVLWSAETVSDEWEETTVDLSAYLGQTITLAFKYAGNDGNDWYVDDVEVSVAPATMVTQTIELLAGYNWVSLYVEVEDPMEMLVQLETALGDRGITIDADGIGTENFGDGEWFGDLDFEGVYNEQMYLIQVSEDCTIELEGAPIDPSVHEIYIHAGYNWIGFPYAEELDINVAFSGFEAEDEDYIETPEGISYYFGEWMGDIMTLVPGQGYMYFSNSEDVKTLVIQTGGSKARVKVVSPNKTKNEEKPRPRLDDKR